MLASSKQRSQLFHSGDTGEKCLIYPVSKGHACELIVLFYTSMQLEEEFEFQYQLLHTSYKILSGH